MLRIFAYCIFFPFCLLSGAWAREIVSVDRDTVIQADFLGVNAVHHGFSFLPEAQEMGMNDSLRTVELARINASGIRIARTWYRPDWAMGDGPWLRPNWNSDKMRALYAWLAEMQKIGVDVALNMGWFFPRDVIWNRDQHIATYPADRDRFCEWLSESIHQLVEVRGFTNVKYLFMFTEPSVAYGDAPWARRKVWDYYKDVLSAANQRLIADGRRGLVKIIGPNTSETQSWLESAAHELNDVIDIYATHTYNLTTYRQWYDMALQAKATVAKTGKPFWIDEYGAQDAALRQSGRYGTFIAEANAAFLNAGAQTSMIWMMSDQYYPDPVKHYTSGDAFLDGKHSWGLFAWLPESRAMHPAWDAFVLIARLMGEAGGRVLETKGGVDLSVAAVEQERGGLRVLVVNGGKERRDFSLALSKPLTAPIHRYVYAPDKTPSAGIGEAETTNSEGRQTIDDSLDPGEFVIYSSDKMTIDGLRSEQDGAGEGFDNLAFGKPVETSSVDSGWSAVGLTDGMRLTSWRSAAGKRGHEEWATVDLGQAHELRLVEIAPGHDGEQHVPSITTSDVKISLSVNGKQWHPVPTQANEAMPGGVLLASFAPQHARYVRVTVSARRQGSSDRQFRALLGEVKVFGR